MTSPGQVLKSIGPKLVPFFKTVAVYFVLFIPVDNPSVWAMFIKCAPILSLMIFVLLHGMSLGDEYTFSRRILIGLVFSCIGDACLVWPDYFLHGMSSFGIAQIFYIRAFGFENLNLPLAVPIYSVCLYILTIFSDKTTGLYTFGVPAYSFLLMTMVWRATARVRLSRNQWTWTEICSCVGGIFFALSDGVIGFDRFHGPVPHSQVLIMSTYYLAQLGIALSVVDSSSVYKQQKLLENASKKNSTSSNVPSASIKNNKLSNSDIQCN